MGQIYGNKTTKLIKLFKDWFWYVLSVEVVKKERIPVANVSGVVSKKIELKLSAYFTTIL